MARLHAYKVFSPDPDLLEQLACLSEETVEEASVLLELLRSHNNDVAGRVRKAKRSNTRRMKSSMEFSEP